MDGDLLQAAQASLGFRQGILALPGLGHSLPVQGLNLANSLVNQG